MEYPAPKNECESMDAYRQRKAHYYLANRRFFLHTDTVLSIK